MREQELMESFWLVSIGGIGQKSVEKLLAEAGEISKVAQLSDEKLQACLGAARAEKLRAANTKEARSRAWNRLMRIYEKKIAFLPRWHPDYPARLRMIPDPPLMLFVKGRLPEEGQKQAALIGARACSAYGAQMARFFSDRLARAGVGIVSGMARGIDSIAQESALAAGQPSLAVLGCGVDICYPPENHRLYEWLAREGCLVSEYFPGTQPQARLFPPRNRIISGLSDLVLVIEAREKSGTLITVDMALEQGREVFAVPGRIMDLCSQGCNRLIANGAGIATGPEAVLEALTGCCGLAGGGGPVGALSGPVSGSVQPAPAQGHPLSARLLAALGNDFLSLDELTARTGADLSEVMQELMHLYMEGTVISQGGRYCRKM